MKETAALLKKAGVQPSAQRVAVAKYVLETHDHPSADEVWEKVRKTFPMISRATVYNTLNHFVEKGLLARHVIAEGKVVFDCVVEPHHHFIDDDTGRIHDVPWDALTVGRVDRLAGFDVREYQVVLRGRKTGRKPGA
jgi:Fur family peroxide stress response transcriptional regulator